MATDEVKQGVLRFMKEWVPKVKAGNLGERQNDREFISDLYEAFGISKNNFRQGFEYKVRIDGGIKRIDSLLPKLLIIEMESQGVKIVDNEKSGYEQAARYAYALKDEEKPKYILASDFENFYIKNPATGDVWESTIYDLDKNIDIFSFLFGFEQQKQEQQVQVNKKAAESISKIYTHILDTGVQQNAASLLMTRIVFALFADDTEIFREKGAFQDLLLSSNEDGSDLLQKLIELFNQLNTPDAQWLGTNRNFRYINGGLFAMDLAKYTSNLGLQFNEKVRESLIEASKMDWSQISPVIFGSMFEGALDAEKRHDLGAHFTSETNILKVVDSLFMDDLREELRVAESKATNGGARTKALNTLHDKISNFKFLDPAAGSGNFLIVGYRELRRLEHEILEELLKVQDEDEVQMSMDFVQENVKVEVNQFYGIEIQGYAVSIARVGMWLMDHLMNLEASKLFGQLYTRIPLHDGANIVQADALEVDWIEVFNKNNSDGNNFSHLKTSELSYILGNPPFIGSRVMDENQKNR